MRTDDFDFNLPEELIAQHPIEKRDESKLMILNKDTGSIKHEVFHNIIDYLNEGDVLVLNDTKVIPARLFGIKQDTLASIELLLLKTTKKDTWECLVKPAKRVKIGTIVDFGGILKAKCISVKEEGLREFEFIYDGVFYEILDKLGTMPLPPYIREKLKDKDRYQTVYAKNLGSAAAPTAGLHFTKELLEKLENNQNQYGLHYSKRYYLLNGLVKCGDCGRSFSGNTSFCGRNKAEYSTYRCGNYRGECNNKAVNTDYLNGFVIGILQDIIFSEKNYDTMIKAFNGKIDSKKSENQII